MLVEIVKVQNRYGLNILSGYRAGNLVRSSNTVHPELFSTVHAAEEYCKEIGFNVFRSYDEVNVTPIDFNAIMERTK